MTTPERHIIAAVAISTFVTLFNIVAVTSGDAHAYYSNIEQFLSHLTPGN